MEIRQESASAGNGPAVAVRQLTKVYGSVRRGGVKAVDDLTLSVDKGEIFGLLGPNGAGKSTLIKVLLGVVRPSSGAAEVLGGAINRAKTRRHIGYLPENHRFPEYLTGRQMLEIYGQMADVPADLIKERIPVLLRQVNLTHWADTRIRKYSKGMMQRIGLAQAMINDPKILFLDEPTDGVDPLGRKEIRNILLKLRAAGKTIFLNSHLLAEVEQVCTRVAILDRGKLVFDGKLSELADQATTYDLRCSAVPDEALTSTGGCTLSVTDAPDNGPRLYRVAANDVASLNGLIDNLRSAGVEIHELAARRKSLEDYFIEVVSAEETGEAAE